MKCGDSLAKDSIRNWLICGTIPRTDFPLQEAQCSLQGDDLVLSTGERLRVERGTPSLAAAACALCQELQIPPPSVLLAGDQGNGEGSRSLYAYLCAMLASRSYAGFTFHYLFPDLDWHNRVFMALQEVNPPPYLAADAGFMYVAKMSGYADYYDLFTPDAGEMAFLSDEFAPHPFYTRGFLLSQDTDVSELLARALKHGNCAKNLLIKGPKDYIVSEGRIKAVVEDPMVPAMEAIGGTGDFVMGLATGFLMNGDGQALLKAARLNRLMGQLAQPTPATQIKELLPYLSQACRLLAAYDSPA